VSGDQSSTTRGPYSGRTGGRTADEGRPSVALAENVRAYRLLEHMTQDDLSLRMKKLGHDWGRSTVSAVELRNRNVVTDELFGLAVCFGVTIGRLLDPTGPDHSRNLSFDVGIAVDGSPCLIEPQIGQLWGASRVRVRLWHDDGREYALDVAADDSSLAAKRSALGAERSEQS
jgi:transcriptional regulator with XRE-family HTH domain